jgi:hypothetical protein
MSWYLAYRGNDYTLLFVYKSKELALDAAYCFLDHNDSADGIEAGPMVEIGQWTLNSNDLRRLYKRRRSRSQA